MPSSTTQRMSMLVLRTPAGRVVARFGLVAGCVLLGLASGLSPGLTALVVGVAVVGFALARYPERVGYFTVGLVLAVPTGWTVGAMLPTDVPLWGVTISITILLPVLVIAMSALLLLPISEARRERVPRDIRVLLGATAAWLGAGVVLLATGAAHNGFLDAAKDFQYIVLWGWVVVPMLAYAHGRLWSLRRTLDAIVFGGSIYSCGMILFYLAPVSFRQRIYVASADDWASTNRVGFGNGQVLALALPLILCLIASNEIRAGKRWLAGLAGTVMIVAVGLSQTRVLMAVTFLSCVLAWVAIGRPGSAFVRGRVVVYVTMVLSALVVVLAVLILAGVGRFESLPSDFAGRFSSSAVYGPRSTLWARGNTNAAAFARWRTNARSVAVGDGLGTQLKVYTPKGRFATESTLVDDVWAMLAVKGGLLALVPFLGLAIVCMRAFVRAARYAELPFDRQVWRTVSVVFPLLLVSTTIFTSHLFKSPAPVLATSTLVCLAALAPRLTAERVEAVPAGPSGQSLR